MKPTILTLLAALFASVGALAAGPPTTTSAMPEVLYVEAWSTDWPVWVRADRVWTGTEINPELFSPSRRDAVRELLFERERDADGCVLQTEIIASGVGGPRLFGDMAKKVEAADAILVVEVTGIANGFMGSQAGSLLRVRSSKALKGTYRSWPHFLFLPQGEFEVAGICVRRRDSRYVSLPELRDRLILFLPPHWEHTKEFLVLPEDSIVILDQKGHVSLPSTYRGDSSLQVPKASATEFLDHVEGLLQRSEEVQQ